MHYLQEVHEKCRQASIVGEKRTRNGVHLYGHMPWKGPEAWFHQIFPPLTDYQIKRLQGDLLIEIPDEIADFFSLTNGLILFAGAFALYGRRDGSSFDPEVRVPFDIVPVNCFERPPGMGPRMLIVGGYRWGKGGYIAVDTDTGRAVACTRISGKSLFEWPTFEQMLRSEVARLALMFDSTGQKYDLSQNELPWEAIAG